jgi:hypothetical protein
MSCKYEATGDYSCTSVIKAEKFSNIENFEDPCAGYAPGSTGVSRECYNQIWKGVGCTTTPDDRQYEWAKNQAIETLKPDAALWADRRNTDRTAGCYGNN